MPDGSLGDATFSPLAPWLAEYPAGQRPASASSMQVDSGQSLSTQLCPVLQLADVHCPAVVVGATSAQAAEQAFSYVMPLTPHTGSLAGSCYAGGDVGQTACTPCARSRVPTTPEPGNRRRPRGRRRRATNTSVARLPRRTGCGGPRVQQDNRATIHDSSQSSRPSRATRRPGASRAGHAFWRGSSPATLGRRDG